MTISGCGRFFWEKMEANSEMDSNVLTSLRFYQYSIEYIECICFILYASSHDDDDDDDDDHNNNNNDDDDDDDDDHKNNNNNNNNRLKFCFF